ncbi:MAG: ABC transporter ATP-binding protein [Blastocatellia bacterium]
MAEAVFSKLSYFSLRLLNSLSYLPRAISLVWKASGKWSIAWAAVLIVQGILPVAAVYLTKALVDGLVAVMGEGRDSAKLRELLVWAILMAVVALASETLRGVSIIIRTAQSELLGDYITGLIHRQSVIVDYAFYEMPDYYDHLYRAREDASYRAVELIEILGELLQDGITLCGMAVALTMFEWYLPIALLFSTFPALVVVMRHALKEHEWRLKKTGDERRAWYYDWVLTTDVAAAEIRLFGLGPHFQNAYQTIRAALRGEHLKLTRRQSLENFFAGLFAMAVTGVVMALLALQAVQGKVTLGTLALFYQAFNQGQGLMRALLGNVGQLYANSLFLGNLFEFLALKPRVCDPMDMAQPAPAPSPIKDGIEFRGVTFAYPGSERAVLRNFDFKLSAGKITAIVGLNGAGKTTLIKLICRFYDPQSGGVLIDGVDIRRMKLDDLRRMITVLFQQPVHYNVTVAENIRLGDATADVSVESLESAIRSAGAEEIIRRLPRGHESVLGKLFIEGNELSVGEWQRIALARAFWRNSPIVLLDEPTSAMDSWAEAEWLNRFREVTAQRTALLITHRFTTAMRADVIHVMVGGEIVESGRHEELISLDGVYAQSWHEQTKGLQRV